MFGESMNLFELGGRVEGLEHLLETYFGPSGYFKNSDKSSDSFTPSDPKPAKLSSNKLDAIHQQVSSKTYKMIYSKIPRYSETRKHCLNYPRIRVRQMAKNVDPDQAPLGAV